MSAQAYGPDEGPLAESTVGAIKAVLSLYDRRRLTLQSAIEEITTLVERDRALRPLTAQIPPTLQDAMPTDALSPPNPDAAASPATNHSTSKEPT